MRFGFNLREHMNSDTTEKVENVALISPIDWVKRRHLTVEEVWPGVGQCHAYFNHAQFIVHHPDEHRGMHQPIE